MFAFVHKRRRGNVYEQKYDSVDAIAAKVKGKKAAFVKGGVMVGRKK